MKLTKENKRVLVNMSIVAAAMLIPFIIIAGTALGGNYLFTLQDKNRPPPPASNQSATRRQNRPEKPAGSAAPSKNTSGSGKNTISRSRRNSPIS